MGELPKTYVRENVCSYSLWLCLVSHHFHVTTQTRMDIPCIPIRVCSYATFRRSCFRASLVMELPILGCRNCLLTDTGFVIFSRLSYFDPCLTGNCFLFARLVSKQAHHLCGRESHRGRLSLDRWHVTCFLQPSAERRQLARALSSVGNCAPPES